MKAKPIRGWKDSCSYADHIKCPYCGYVNYDSWEYCLDDDREEEIECPNCEEDFNVVANFSITYSSFPK